MADLRRSLVINFFTFSGATLMQFIVSVLLARILSPSELGVFSIAIVFVNIAHIFRDFGVGSYLQSEPDLTPARLRSAMGVLFTSSWAIAALLFAISPWFGQWFNEPNMVPLIRVLAVGFLIIPFGSITNALLTRELAAEKQAFIGAAGTIAYCVSCLWLAWTGHGTMSLAWANLISVTVVAICGIPFRPKAMPWLPSFKNWRGIVHYGAGSLLSNTTTAVNNSIPDLLLGKIAGSHEVGLFSRANSTVSIFSYVAGSTVTYGALSYFSRLYHSGESLVPLISRATSLLTAVAWPAFAFTGIFGREIVLALYGEKWLHCVPAIAPLAIAAAISMAFHYAPTALTAVGRPYLAAVPVGITLLLRVIFGIVLYDGSLTSFAWAMCLAAVVTAPVLFYQQRRNFGFSASALVKSVTGSLIVSGICLAVMQLSDMLIPQQFAPALRLCLAALPAVFVWYIALRLTRHELLAEVNSLAVSAKGKFSRLHPGRKTDLEG